MNAKDPLMDNAEQAAKAVAFDAQESGHKLDHDSRLDWWREARLGLFIHWGLYSLPAGIWNGEEVTGAYAEHVMLRARIPAKQYERIADQFNPLKFDADQWVLTAKAAGLKYVVFTAKHHDGFAMYDSKVSDYNIVQKTPFARDPLAEMSEACRRHNIVLCIYYFHSMDWHHPDSQGNTWDYPENIGAYDPVESWIGDQDKSSRYEKYLEEKALPQVRELLTQYGPVGVLWFDCGHKLTQEQGERFIDLVRSIQPDCLVNRRVWLEPLGDYGNTSDNQPHVRIPRRDWESIATLNDSWGYKKNDHNWKPAKEIVHQIIDTVSMNGNFLINVGPTGEGEFDPESMTRLGEIGTWLETNGDSIYGTVKSPIGKLPWGRCTMKDRRVYLHMFERPASGNLIVPGIRSQIINVFSLADPEQQPLPYRRISDMDWSIDISGLPCNSFATVIVLEIPSLAEFVPDRLLVDSDFPNVFEAFEGDITGNILRYDTGKKGRNNVTDWSDKADWISWRFRANKPGTFRLLVSYGAEASSNGGEFVVKIGEQERIAKVMDTGGRYDFEEFELGLIDIPAGYPQTLTITAKSINGSELMNLQKVVLC
jgi:alpha-L-fucosidase